MGLFGSRKLFLVLVIAAYVFFGSAQAWSFSWSFGPHNSNWHWGPGGNSGGSSGLIPGLTWGWGLGPWGSNGGNSGDSSGPSPGSYSGGSSGSTLGSNSGGSSGSIPGSNIGGSKWGQGWSSNNIDTNWGWESISGSSGSGSTHHNQTNPSNNMVSAGSTNNNHNHTIPISPRRMIVITVWKKGFDYQEWFSKHAPFYVNDVVVFKYNNDQTQSKTTKHTNKNNVYLLPDLKSYKRCDTNRGKKLAARREPSSRGEGFKLILRKTQPYYFISGDHNDCNHGMKFSLTPIIHLSSQ